MVATIETALDWYRRSQRQHAAAQIPTDPSSAAAAFVRGASGFAPLDAAWRTTPPAIHYPQNNSSHGTNYPVVILEGPIGKTWTLLSLAARFVVMTRASRFVVVDDDDDDDDDQVMEEADSPSEGLTSAASASASASRTTKSQTPQVIILDSNWDMTISKLAYMVRSTLLREPSSSSTDDDDDDDDSTSFHVTEETLEYEVEGCLRRIHLATVDEVQDAWVPTLECLRCKLKDATNHPTLLLWDGFYTDSKQPEVRRQVLRLLQDCSIAMVATGSNSSSINSSSISANRNSGNPCHGRRHQSPVGNRANFDWLRDDKHSKRDLHRVQLEHKLNKDCFAIVNGSKLPFSISLGGVLC